MHHTHKHIFHNDFGYLETLQRKGKTGVGMTPTNLHYYSNKVPVKAYNMLTLIDLPCERPALLKVVETVKSHLVKGFYHLVRSEPF